MSPTRPLRPVLLALVLLPAAAGAADDSISNELGFGAGQTSPTVPRTGEISDTVSGTLGLGKGWSLDLMAGITAIGKTKGIIGKQFGDRGGDVLDLGAGVDYEAGEHSTLGLTLNVSPSSRLVADSAVSYTSGTQSVSADALVAATSSSRSVKGSYSYDTAGDSNLEAAVDLDLGVNHFDTDQRIVALRTASGAVATAAELYAYCTTHKCSKQLLGLLRQRPAALDQTEADAGVTLTVHRDTDLGLSGTYYFYDRDPTQLGFFTLMTAGRGTASFGAGAPLAPVQWSVSPQVTQRFGDFSARLWVVHGPYVDGEGQTNLVGLKLQYKFTRSFRAWITGTWERDQDSSGNAYAFSQALLGVMWLF